MRVFEAITNQAQAPSRFWLVFDIPAMPKERDPNRGPDEWQDAVDQRTLKQLNDISRGVLEGVKGISDSKEIVTGWWMVARNAVVSMDASKVIQVNDVEKIYYDDPDHLCQDGFRLLYRIWDKKPDETKKWDGMMQNLIQYFVSGLKNLPNGEGTYAASQLEYIGFRSKAEEHWHHRNSGVNDLQSAAHWIYNLATTGGKEWENKEIAERLTSEMVLSALTAALKHVGRIYQDESEWLVHSPEFHIPSGSSLLVGTSMKAAAAYQQWKTDPNSVEGAMSPLGMPMSLGYALERHDELMKSIDKYHLRDHYKIAFVDETRFGEVRDLVKARRSKARNQ